ncbi:hypothetical protein CHCC20488_3582 [Bacillus paralicheniformis]|nr:hypothetical protein SC10_B2orf06118 [Bacillus paralicheniformis]GLI90988.1 hypothetical protein ANABIO4_43700 [Bacillus subtilis]OLG05104.1 hypothetical protein B4125_3176 [Bacillus paralicheniformis]TWJ76994.1 hypothetical protein CHCC20497_0542 [Bacillus paralicheniformis]TWK26502.1 hypothetical protein CHCC20372_1546 [Bacillus paralicheniformis]
MTIKLPYSRAFRLVRDESGVQMIQKDGLYVLKMRCEEDDELCIYP